MFLFSMQSTANAFMNRISIFINLIAVCLYLKLIWSRILFLNNY